MHQSYLFQVALAIIFLIPHETLPIAAGVWSHYHVVEFTGAADYLGCQRLIYFSCSRLVAWHFVRGSSVR